jgi:hypothetical protein
MESLNLSVLNFFTNVISWRAGGGDNRFQILNLCCAYNGFNSHLYTVSSDLHWLDLYEVVDIQALQCKLYARRCKCNIRQVLFTTIMNT